MILNQPGDAPTVMNFQDNFGRILAMAGFVPSAEFHAPDPNPDLLGTPLEGVLIRQQVLGIYGVFPLAITSEPLTLVADGTPYSYAVTASGGPAPALSLDSGPPGMTMGPDGVVEWIAGPPGAYDVSVRASNGLENDAIQDYSLMVVDTNTCDVVPIFGQVDSNDVNAIFDARNTPATGPGDPRDADADGQITVLDGRICEEQCTWTNCATQKPRPACGSGPELLLVVGLLTLARRRRSRA